MCRRQSIKLQKLVKAIPFSAQLFMPSLIMARNVSKTSCTRSLEIAACSLTKDILRNWVICKEWTLSEHTKVLQLSDTGKWQGDVWEGKEIVTMRNAKTWARICLWTSPASVYASQVSFDFGRSRICRAALNVKCICTSYSCRSKWKKKVPDVLGL